MIYLDSAATTRPSDGVSAFLAEALAKYYANPDSGHAAGLLAGKQIENARAALAGVIKAQPDEIIFTSSGTEANNLALFGALGRRGGKIIVSDAEHPSVYMPAKELAGRGFEIIYLSGKGGAIDLDELREALDGRVILVSVMLANNETGAVYDVKKICETVHGTYKNADFRPYVHTDAVQGFGKLEINMNRLKADMLTASAHKIHGIKGAGLLYLRRGTRISAQMLGGGQERGLRSSTLNTPGILAFGKAAEELSIAADYQAVSGLYDYAAAKISRECPGIRFNQEQSGNFSKYILSLRLPNVRSEVMLNYLSSRDIYISSGAACSSKNSRESARVLLNYGLDKFSADFTVRVSFCKYNTRADIDALAGALADGIARYAVH